MSAATAAAAARPAAGRLTLGAAARLFCRSANARIEAAAVAALLVARLLAGAPTGSDVLVVAALLAAQPFFEWAFHLYVLHYRPVRVLGRVVDFELARKHREHHADPAVVELVFVPLRSLVALMAGAVAIALPFSSGRPAVITALATGALVLLAYEWTHYLIHSSYRPKSRLFRAIRRAHRLHHFKNEQYWFGVMSPAADVVLGTNPDPAAVGVSATARNLGGR